MKKTSALFISLLLVISIFLISQYRRPSNEILESATVQRVIDGDTIKLDDGRIIRLININTPEKGERYYDEAKDYLKILENQSVNLKITGTEKYGRLLGKIYAPEYINLKIVEEGFAHSFLVAEDEIGKFKDAQNSAFKNQKGVWNRSVSYGCLDAQINKKEEYVELTLGCNVAVNRWMISDESTKKYIIKGQFDHVRLYSNEGKDNKTAIYWGEGNVWNDNRDSLFIRDEKGFLVNYVQYGY